MTERNEVGEIWPELEWIRDADLRESALKIGESLGDDMSVDLDILKA
jgi:hypothetical protein